ncbi:hypothetical protein ABW20_dc0108161 [Dactylellina cionopaga]|nr:hypothetical protein ABW20_dc0108161 [Dactylellina cionopaga]
MAPQVARNTPRLGTPTFQHNHPSNIAIDSPSATVRIADTVKASCASLEFTRRGGSPNSFIAYAALKNGIAPPKVNVVPMKRPGMWRGEK